MSNLLSSLLLFDTNITYSFQTLVRVRRCSLVIEWTALVCQTDCYIRRRQVAAPAETIHQHWVQVLQDHTVESCDLLAETCLCTITPKWQCIKNCWFQELQTEMILYKCRYSSERREDAAVAHASASRLKVWHHLRDLTPSIEAHLLEEQYRKISSRSNLKRRSLMQRCHKFHNKNKNKMSSWLTDSESN